MKRAMIPIALLLALTSTQAATIRVPSEQPTIQAGINAASEGDTVLIADGVYSGADNVGVTIVGKNVVVKSENGPSSTVIDCDRWNAAFYFYTDEIDASTVVDGIQIRNGLGVAGGAISIQISSPTIKNCWFVANEAPNGGAIYANSSSLITVVACEFRGNTCAEYADPDGNGGAIYFQYQDCAILVRDCIFSENQARLGGAISCQSGAYLIVENCTFAQNGSTELGGCVYQHSTTTNSVLLSKSILAFATTGQAVWCDGTAITATCCDLFGNSGGDWVGGIAAQASIAGNMNVDPLFCEIQNHDLNIRSNSPCAPQNNSCSSLIGALQEGCGVIEEVYVDGEISPSHVISEWPVFSWTFTDDPSISQSEFELEVDSDGDWSEVDMWQSGVTESANMSISYSGNELLDGQTYYARLRVGDGQMRSLWYTLSFRMNGLPNTPTILSPCSGSVTGSVPVFWFVGSTDADGDQLTYDLQVYLDGELQYLALSQAGVEQQPDSTSYSWGATMPENQPLWWRCRAFDGFEYSDWSPLTMFYVDGNPEAPTQPEGTAPIADSYSILYEMLPAFEWTEASDPDPLDQVHYKLELALDPGFVFHSDIDGIQGLSYKLTDSLAFDEQYWWRVSAVDEGGLSTTSEVRSFWT